MTKITETCWSILASFALRLEEITTSFTKMELLRIISIMSEYIRIIVGPEIALVEEDLFSCQSTLQI